MTDNNLMEAAPSTKRRRRVWLFWLVVWSALAGLGLWWLLRSDSSPSVVIFREGDAVQPAVSEKFRAWFKTDLGLQRIYPWVLFGPYVALVAWWFPLERNWLRRNGVLNLAACVAFITASHALNARLSVTGARVVFVNSQHLITTPGGAATTNTTYVKIIKGEAPDLLEEQIAKSVPFPAPVDGKLEFTTQHFQNPTSSSVSNLFTQRRTPLDPMLGWSGKPKFNIFSWVMDLLAYSAIVGLAHSVHFYKRFREREHRALVLESSLVNARLNTLRAQLQPHFLFNSLNAIAALLRRDPRLAEATLMSLSELLRLALSQSERQEVALREEMSLVQHYLEIQRTRFGDKLKVEQDIDPATLDCQVPTLVLQPLVENAIRHGLEPSESAGLIRVTACRCDNRLVLEVEDDGVGLTNLPCEAIEPANPSPQQEADEPARSRGSRMTGSGIGLKNLRARLQALYGENQKLELKARAGGGVAVKIEIPWCTEARMVNSTMPCNE